MNTSVVKAINRQINSELSASYSYLSMSAWCERQKFTGAARSGAYVPEWETAKTVA